MTETPWMPMPDAPKDGTQFSVRWEDGSVEHDVYWADQRYCMLGAPQGSRGPGWLSTQAGHLPIDAEDGIAAWRYADHSSA